MIRHVLVLLVLILAGCSPAAEVQEPEATPEAAATFQAISFLGDSLYGSAQAASDERQLSLLEEARAELAADPHDPEALVWVGRRLGYLQRYDQAIEAFGEGIEAHPGDARFYRHRGHRYISTRRLDEAISDFERAVALIQGTEDEVEPDGLPNERGIPTSTLHFNIWYHLGLAHYLLGDFERALDAYRECLEVSKNPDALVATSHWLYMILRRLDRRDEAARVLTPITADLDVIENAAYHDLLLMYKGERTAEDLLEPEDEASPSGAAVAYGVGNWYLYNDRHSEALEVFSRILEDRSQWPAFGYIAAEAEVARINGIPVGRERS